MKLAIGIFLQDNHLGEKTQMVFFCHFVHLSKVTKLEMHLYKETAHEK